jgi:HK97 family phage major capsid protein
MSTDLKAARGMLVAQLRNMVGNDGIVKDDADVPKCDSVEAAIRLLDQVDKATLSGVSMADLEVTPTGGLVQKRKSSHDLHRVDLKTGERYLPGEGGDHPSTAAGTRPKYCRDIFGEAPEKSPYKSIEEVAWMIGQGNGRSLAVSGASKGVPSDGGFLIPSQQVFDMLDASVEKEIVRPRCRVEGMQYAEKTISTYDDSTHANGELFGGLSLQWAAEGDEIDYKTAQVRQIKLQAKKATMLCAATNELLADAPSFGSGLGDRMITALAFGLDRAFLISGTGSGQPRSVMNDGATITVAKVTNQTAATIVYDNLVSMMARMHPACFNNSVWVIHQSAIPQLLTLSISVGTGGSAIPVMTETNGQFKILTRPVIFSELLNPVGQLGDIMLVDLSQYVIGLQKDGFRLDTSAHVLFRSDQQVYRLVCRIDGMGCWKQAFQPLNSAPTLSWAVTLAARA